MAIRAALVSNLKQAAISKIIIERPHKKCRVTIHSARPGVVIGKKGADIDKIRKLVAKMTDSEVLINIVEVRKPRSTRPWLPIPSPSSSNAGSPSAVP